MVSHTLHQPTAGIVKQLRLENFMCHSKHETEFGNHVNFITGQNGSGKSTILAALCVAFGCRAKETQRTSTLKDFIKTGATDAVIQVEIQNEGEGAFKPEIYGPVIIVERRISESTSSATLKDHQGRKVVSWKTDLLEIVEHFNIDVENPCVIMNQDKSREFLHSGNNKDKFKVTLLQQVNDLLESISHRGAFYGSGFGKSFQSSQLSGLTCDYCPTPGLVFGHWYPKDPIPFTSFFSIFLDAVSRKISLDPLVDFAEAHGSQRIFITPHDTSSVRAGDRIKKVQIAAPRS
ncbi:Structural maintenance of chromosomes protein 6A [Glycine max]|nr:Structural maintenance of chromosomes protein 6A [Glycine max]